MGKIADTIYKELNYMYCDNCRYNNEITDKDEYGDSHCEDCHRKYNGWAVSKQTAEHIEELCKGGADMRSEPCSHDCDQCEHGVPIDGQFYDDGLPIHECGIKPTEQSEQEAKQYALGYQDGFLDAKKVFGGDAK